MEERRREKVHLSHPPWVVVDYHDPIVAPDYTNKQYAMEETAKRLLLRACKAWGSVVPLELCMQGVYDFSLRGWRTLNSNLCELPTITLAAPCHVQNTHLFLEVEQVEDSHKKNCLVLTKQHKHVFGCPQRHHKCIHSCRASTR